MPEPVTVELYSDIHCPWAYMAVYRLRQVWPSYKGRVRLAFRALSLELKNGRSTPKPVLEQEIPLMQEQQPDLPIKQWTAPEWRYVPTILPAFEAEKAAQEQGDDAAWEFNWYVRHAFFARNRTICMRYALEDVARQAGLDVERFLRDWDSGRFRERVIAESHRGWEELEVPGSPTFVLPSGKQIHNPAAMKVTWSKAGKIESTQQAECPDGDCLAVYRSMLDEALSSS